MSEWIKVEDELPEINVKVIARCIRQGEPSVRFTAFDRRIVSCVNPMSTRWKDHPGRVTHWMYLPCPPQNEEKTRRCVIENEFTP